MQVAHGLRTLARDIHAGRISRETYRRERRRLLADLTDHAHLTTRTLPQKLRPAVQRTEEKKQTSSAQPQNLRIAGLVVVVLAALALGWALLTRDDAAPVRPSGTAGEARVTSPTERARSLIEEFRTRDDWSPGALRSLGATWRTLPEPVREISLRAQWFQPFADNVQDRVHAQEAYLEIRPDARNSEADIALLGLAREMGLYSGFDALPGDPAPDRGGPGRDDLDEIVSAQPASVVEPGMDVLPPAMNPGAPTATGATDAQRGAAGLAAATGRAADTGPDAGPESSAKTSANSRRGGAPTERPQTNAEATRDPAILAKAPAAARRSGDGCNVGLLQSRRRFCRDAMSAGGEGPLMHVLPPGVFSMGDDEVPDAAPAHEVHIDAPLAIAVYETSVKEYREFCSSTGYRCPEAYWPADDFPVVGVSWDDAAAYVAWLAKETGAMYRLPSEAEWEYAARGGTSSPFPYGEELLPADARFSVSAPLDSPMPRSNRAIGRNGFGLYHVVGNVREWVADAWHDGHSGAPADGSPREGGAARVVRGGSYADTEQDLRSASRVALDKSAADRMTGFRVLREFSR